MTSLLLSTTASTTFALIEDPPRVPLNPPPETQKKTKLSFDLPFLDAEEDEVVLEGLKALVGKETESAVAKEHRFSLQTWVENATSNTTEMAFYSSFIQFNRAD